MKRVRIGQGLVAQAVALGVSASAALAATQSADQPSPTPPLSAADPYFSKAEFELGATDAPITVIEYLSVSCAHCAAFERDTWPRVASELVATGKVRFIIREMPTAPVAASAAGFLLARCEGESRYWDVVQSLLSRQDEFLFARDIASAVQAEQKIAEISREKADQCLSNVEAIDAINVRREQGVNAGVDSTPYFIVDGKPLRPGVRLAGKIYQGGEISFAQLSDAIDHAKAKVGSF